MTRKRKPKTLIKIDDVIEIVGGSLGLSFSDNFNQVYSYDKQIDVTEIPEMLILNLKKLGFLNPMRIDVSTNDDKTDEIP